MAAFCLQMDLTPRGWQNSEVLKKTFFSINHKKFLGSNLINSHLTNHKTVKPVKQLKFKGAGDKYYSFATPAKRSKFFALAAMAP